MEIILDAAFLGEREQAHDYLKEMLDLPAYYGRNLDALYDCLSEKEDITLIIKNADIAGAYFRRLLPVFYDSVAEVIMENPDETAGDRTDASDSSDYDDSSDGDN